MAESNGEKDALRAQLDAERREHVDERLNDHEGRIRSIERTAITREDCGRLVVEQASAGKERETRIRKLEELANQSLGVGIIGKLLIPALVAAGATLIIKLIFK